MPNSHLIIGSGNMGKRHAQCLKTLGEDVEMVDIEFRPERASWSSYSPKSVIIATPANTHSQIINNIPPYVPIFCEKPLIVALKEKIATRTAPTLMACNWTWCKCIRTAKSLLVGYPEPSGLDYIHFVLLPKLEVRIVDCPYPLAGIDDKEQIHRDGPCDMFVRQMKHWLNVLKGKEKSRLPFEEAYKYNRKLLQNVG